MKHFAGFVIVSFLITVIGFTGCHEGVYSQGETEDTVLYYAIEMNGTLCGFARILEREILEDSGKMLMQEAHYDLQMELMGKDVSIIFSLKNYRDPITGRINMSRTRIRQGKIDLQGSTLVIGDSVIFKGGLIQGEKNIMISDSVLTENLLYYPHLVKSFSKKGMTVRGFSVLDDAHRQIIRKIYTFIGKDTLEINGNIYHALILHEFNSTTAETSDLWIHVDDGLILKSMNYITGKNIILSNRDIMGKTSKVNVDDMIFYNVNLVINDFREITRMRLEARIQTSGEVISESGLSCPGQRFIGSVENNLISGTFETTSSRYDGEGAPDFPHDFSSDSTLVIYLEPGELIESDDPSIKGEAEKITIGAEDLWDAAIMLSRWVEKNIVGAIPGGGSAKGTFELRKAECGGHSRLLTALCRSVGIPAR
ncbi:MAG: transglutaminase-like domain-containing protein, partial [Bacteroidetes bacterium]|nr:transglutaminase-like domain-containing protein [Bacteroidota bacterium]